MGILLLLCISPASAQTSSITAIQPASHPNLYFNQTEINQLRQAVLVDRSPPYAVDAWNLVKNTRPRGKPAQMDTLAWPDNYQAALPATQANFEATLSYLIEPTAEKAHQLKAALLSWSATQQGSWIPDVQYGAHIHFALAFMYDALYNAGVLTSGEKTTLDSWFQQTAQKTLLTNSRWQQRFLDGESKSIDQEGSYRDDYPNWYQFRVMGSVVTALVSHDQASVDAAANSPLPAAAFRLDTINQSAPATRDFKNMLTGLIYPSGYTWDGYARHYGFKAPAESYAGQQAGEGQHYHFFALMPVVLAAEAVAHNGFDAWNHNDQAIRRSFVTGKPWAHQAHRSSDPPGTVRNWLPFYWLVYRHFPTDPTIRAAVQDPRSRNRFSYTVHNSAPLWGLLGERGSNPVPTVAPSPTPTLSQPSPTPSPENPLPTVAPSPTPTLSQPSPTPFAGNPLPTVAPSPTPTTSQPSPTPFAGNLLTNSEFENGTTGWQFHSTGTAVFSVASPGYNSAQAGKLLMHESGGTTQLYQTGLVLETGQQYLLSFAAKANRSRSLAIHIIKHTQPFSSYGLRIAVPLTTHWQEYTILFPAEGFSGTVSDSRFRFFLGSGAQAGDEVQVDQVSLQKVSSSTCLPSVPLDSADHANREGVVECADFSLWLGVRRGTDLTPSPVVQSSGSEMVEPAAATTDGITPLGVETGTEPWRLDAPLEAAMLTPTGLSQSEDSDSDRRIYLPLVQN